MGVEYLEKLDEYYGAGFKGYEVPECVKNTALVIMNRFSIHGECDGMYICNCIAKTCGIGNGQGVFYSGVITNFSEIASSLQLAYGSHIFKEDIPELEEILRMGVLDKGKACNGIEKFINKCKEERNSCDEWRKEYLCICIEQAIMNHATILVYC